jgi:hypothetical protein
VLDSCIMSIIQLHLFLGQTKHEHNYLVSVANNFGLRALDLRCVKAVGKMGAHLLSYGKTMIEKTE